MSERTQTIMDVAAFGSSMLWGGFEVGAIAMPSVMQALESAGIRGATSIGRVAPIVSTLLAFAQFLSTYAALEADVTMSHAPLVRTKKRSPQTGERKELTAIVRMDVGNAEMLNCFRAMLIAVGLDFSLPNHGPVKGARVSWYGVEGFDQAAAVLHGAGEAIVQFVAPEASRIQGSGSASASPITNAITGDDGTVQIGVEGRGQTRDLGENATRVPKSARVRLQVALKGSDLFGDLQEAAGTAAGGLIGLATVPLGILSRVQWASVGHYTFPVTDWRDGPGHWAGTITQTQTEITATVTEGPDGGRSTQETRTETVEVTVTDTTDEQSSGGIGVLATLQGRAHGKTNTQQTTSGWYSKSCGNGPKKRMTGNSRSFSSGAGESESTIMVSVGDDGSYVISASTASLKVTLTGENSSTSQRLTPQCAIENVSESQPHVPSEAVLASSSIGATGMVDPRSPYVVNGSKTVETPAEKIDEQTTRKTSLTTTWNLRRN
jgi:hypothetical protein